MRVRLDLGAIVFVIRVEEAVNHLDMHKWYDKHCQVEHREHKLS